MALGLFRRLLGNRKDIEADAAGVHAVRGQPPSVHAIDVCRRRGVDISSFRSQPLTATLVDRATHIFAMTGSHLETIHLLFPAERGEDIPAARVRRAGRDLLA